MYHSTREKGEITASKAIINGISKEGGLYIPSSMPDFKFDKTFLSLDYKEIAKKVFSAFFDDFTSEEINYVINSAYSKENFKEEIVGIKTFSNYAYLELYKGPTLAFKDMALTALPFLMEVARKKQGIQKKITILTATSGDTGGAALSGFSKSKDIDIVVLYPYNGVSLFQERQMLSFCNEHAHAFAYQGNFDDCQNLVKKIMNEHKNDENILLSSANSINIGRLVPQIVYYFYAYVSLVNKKEIEFNQKINVSVPTGNFGNILALYIAKKLGLPIDKLICSSNMNNVLTDFFNTGTYDSKRKFFKTNAPSMDILISSNLERLLALNSSMDEVNEYMKELKETGQYTISDELKNKLLDFEAYYANEKEVIDEIINEFKTQGYLIDSHTACAKVGYNKSSKSNYTLVVSTADAVKFNVGFEELHIMPKEIDFAKNERIIADEQFVNDFLFAKSIEVKVPSSSANLGSGFDVVGVSLSLYNKYRFIFGKDNRVIFKDERFNALENNLVYKSYSYVFNKYNKNIVPVIIEELENSVPCSRGLGSSSCCIVSGVIAAGKILSLSNEEMFKCMIEIEGHPDNVAPCFYGGLVATINYIPIKYEVNENLHFILGIPNYELKTSDSRGVMPKEYKTQDVVYNLSRLIHLPKAIKEGDINLLKEVTKDRIHEPYRTPLIKNLSEIKEMLLYMPYVVNISGAGPTIVIIGKDLNILDTLKAKYPEINFVNLKVDNVGVVVKESD